jgi:N-acetyl-anhydromuramyl-L-alanine amidase AmpD
MTDNLKIVQRHLPVECYTYSSAGAPKSLKVAGVVEHFFSGRYAFPEDRYDLDKCWQLMRDLNFEPKEREFGLYDGPRMSASAHFLIGRDGTILELVPLEFRAFHAGSSQFNGRKHCNNFMVGIENIGSLGDEYTEAQYIANADLCSYLMLEYEFSVEMITGHENVCIPPGRKKDPGKTFDWNKLRAMIG